MKALCWHGKRDIRCDTVPDPKVEHPRDAIIKVTACAICGSDLHLYNGFMPGMKSGDVMGHETMGEVVELGAEVRNLKIGDRVVVPFTIACGECFFCKKNLFSGCERSNPSPNRELAEALWGHTPAGLFGYTHLLGGYAGGQAEYLRVPYADVGPIKVPSTLSDEQVLFLSDIFPTGYMGAEFCDIQPNDTIAVFGCGPVGQFSIRSAFLLGAERVIAIDTVPERLALAKAAGAITIDFAVEDVHERINELTQGRGADACIDAVGTESEPAASFDASAGSGETDRLDRHRSAPCVAPSDHQHTAMAALSRLSVSMVAYWTRYRWVRQLTVASRSGWRRRRCRNTCQPAGAYREGRDRSLVCGDAFRHPRRRPGPLPRIPRQAGSMHQGDTQAMNEIQLSKFLGWFSLGLGALELLASRRIAATLGVSTPKLVQTFGIREVATGLMVLNKPDTAMPVWGRVAGDIHGCGCAGDRPGV